MPGAQYLRVPDDLQTIGPLQGTAAQVAAAMPNNMSITDWYVYQFSQGVANPSFYGASAGTSQRAADASALAEAQALFASGSRYAPTAGYANGVYVGIDPSSGGSSGAVAGGGYLTLPSGPTGSVSSGGATSVGGVGPGTGGSSIPGGTAGALNGSSASSLIAGLSHSTAGLNWSHLALWLAILAGAYIVLDSIAGGHKGRRRR